MLVSPRVRLVYSQQESRFCEEQSSHGAGSSAWLKKNCKLSRNAVLLERSSLTWIQKQLVGCWTGSIQKVESWNKTWNKIIQCTKFPISPLPVLLLYDISLFVAFFFHFFWIWSGKRYVCTVQKRFHTVPFIDNPHITFSVWSSVCKSRLRQNYEVNLTLPPATNPTNSRDNVSSHLRPSKQFGFSFVTIFWFCLFRHSTRACNHAQSSSCARSP